ncbi:TetR/AcrR family transcriptional regulator [Arthrobacter sp. D1-29]
MPSTREHRSIQERRQQLLDATIHVMCAEGVASATTRAITKQAGLPHGAFHYCFDSKNDLFAALLERELHQAIAAAFEPTGTGVNVQLRIEHGLTTRLEAVKARPDYELALAELAVMSRRDPELQPLTGWEQAACLKALSSYLEKWSADDDITWVAPPEKVAALLIALIDGITSAWLNDRDDERAASSIQLAAQATSSLRKRNTP